MGYAPRIQEEDLAELVPARDLAAPRRVPTWEELMGRQLAVQDALRACREGDWLLWVLGIAAGLWVLVFPVLPVVMVVVAGLVALAVWSAGVSYATRAVEDALRGERRQDG